MKKIVTDDRVIEFVCGTLGVNFFQGCTALGLEDDGKIVAGFLFNNHTTYDIEITVAGSPNSAAPAFLRRVGGYVFEELGCLRMTITTAQEKIVELATRLGAQTEGRKRNHFGKGRDGIVLGILREDWKV